MNGGSVSIGDTIQYFVVAQDLAATPNVGINSGTFAAQPASVALTAAAFPIGGSINSYNIVDSLAGTLKKEAVGAGFAPDLKPFQAHVTVARKVARSPHSLDMPSVLWRFTDFALVESRTEAAGALYSVVDSWTLGR